MRKNKKASVAGVWLGALFAIFVLGMLYITVSEPWDILYTTLSTDLTVEQQAVMDQINNLWTIFPPIMLIGIIVGAAIMSVRQQPPNQGAF